MSLNVSKCAYANTACIPSIMVCLNPGNAAAPWVCLHAKGTVPYVGLRLDPRGIASMKEKHVLQCEALLGWCKNTLGPASVPHEVMAAVVGGIVRYAAPYLSDMAEAVVKLHAAIKAAALQFEKLPKDLSNVAVRSSHGLRLVDVQVIRRDSVVASLAHVLVPPLDGSGGAGLQPVDRVLDDSVTRDYPAFRERSGMVLAQSWATVRGTMVRAPDGQSDPWLQVFADHPAVGNIMGWPREVLPVFQQPLCSLPVLAVAVVLDVGALLLYDRQPRRITPVVTERRSMAVLVGSKQLARIQGDDAHSHVTEAMFSLPEGDDIVAADARHTLDTLGLAAVVEARSGGQRLVFAFARGPRMDGVDVIGEIVQDTYMALTPALDPYLH